MKNLKYHKQQTKFNQTKNRFNAWASAELDKISARVRANSNKRWDELKQEIATLQFIK